MKRLHPRKCWKWIIKKYFPQYDDEGKFIGKYPLLKAQTLTFKINPVKLITLQSPEVIFSL